MGARVACISKRLPAAVRADLSAVVAKYIIAQASAGSGSFDLATNFAVAGFDPQPYSLSLSEAIGILDEENRPQVARTVLPWPPIFNARSLVRAERRWSATGACRGRAAE